MGFIYKTWNFTGKVRNENFAPYMMQPHTKFNRNSCCILTYKTQEKTAKMARSVTSSLYEFLAKKVKHKQEKI